MIVKSRSNPGIPKAEHQSFAELPQLDAPSLESAQTVVESDVIVPAVESTPNSVISDIDAPFVDPSCQDSKGNCVIIIVVVRMHYCHSL